MVGNVLCEYNECNRHICYRNGRYVLTVYLSEALCSLKEGEIGNGNNAHVSEDLKVDYLQRRIIGRNSYNREDCGGGIARKYTDNEGYELYHFLAVNRADGYNQKSYKSAKQADKRVCGGIAFGVKHLALCYIAYRICRKG